MILQKIDSENIMPLMSVLAGRGGNLARKNMNDDKHTLIDRILYERMNEEELRKYAESLDNELLNRALLHKKRDNKDIFAIYRPSAGNADEKLSSLPTDSISPYVALLGSDGNLPEPPATPKPLVKPSLKEIVEKSPIAKPANTKQFEYLLQEAFADKPMTDIVADKYFDSFVEGTINILEDTEPMADTVADKYFNPFVEGTINILEGFASAGRYVGSKLAKLAQVAINPKLTVGRRIAGLTAGLGALALSVSSLYYNENAHKTNDMRYQQANNPIQYQMSAKPRQTIDIEKIRITYFSQEDQEFMRKVKISHKKMQRLSNLYARYGNGDIRMGAQIYADSKRLKQSMGYNY